MDENWKLSVGKKEISGKDRKSLFSAMDDLVMQGDGSPLIINTESDRIIDRAAEYAAQKGYDLVAPTPEQNLRITEKQNALAGEEIVGGDFEPSLERQKQKAVEEVDQEQKDLEQLKKDKARLNDLSLSAWHSTDDEQVRAQKLEEVNKLAADIEAREEVYREKALDQLKKDKERLNEVSLAAWHSTDDEQIRAQKMEEVNRLAADIEAREESFRQMGWLPKEEKAKVVEVPAAEVPVVDTLAKDEKQQAVEKEKTVPAEDVSVVADQAPDQPSPSAKLAKQQMEVDGKSAEKDRDEPAKQQFPKIVPPQTLASRWKVPTVKDHGDKITVTRMGMMNLTPKLAKERDALVTAALLKARERFGEPVRVTPAGGLNKLAGRAFEEAAIKAAIAQGVKLEMATERGRKLYEQALEKERRLAKSMGTLEPSKQREKERALPAPARDKGKSRGLSIA